MLTRNEAIQSMRAGKTIGFIGIKNVEMWLSDGTFLFKHRDGSIEKLDERTLHQNDGYVLVTPTHEKAVIVKRVQKALNLLMMND